MQRSKKMVGAGIVACLSVPAALAVNAAINPADVELPAGKVKLTTAGSLAFGPPGILFVGDSVGASVVAIDTQDTKVPAPNAQLKVDGVDVKIAALVGIAADQIVINDMVVNPVSKNVYVSAARGRGPDAAPLIAKVDLSGKVSLVSLDNAKHATVSLVDAPAEPAADAKKNPRLETITDIAYVNGNVMVAGLSNEEWSSALRSVPYPFKTANEGATLQIWHSSHGRYETASPIRTFVPYTMEGKQYVLAAYTCTPLVKISASDLKPGAKVKGVEIADLGMGNQPLDMVPYKKDGHEYVLIANSALGLMKLKADKMETYPAIAEPTRTDVAGVPYEKLEMKNVQHLAQVDDGHVLVMTGNPGPGPAYAPGPPVGPINLATIALP